MRGLGSENIDFRLRQSDFSADGKRRGAPWLGMKVADIGTRDRVLLIGSFLRKDHPLLATRVRHAVKRGCKVAVVHAVDDELLMPVAHKQIVAPGLWLQSLVEIAVAVAALKGIAAPVAGVTPGAAAQAIAGDFVKGTRAAILLGNAAAQHPQAAQLAAWAQWIAQATGASFGVIGEAANSVGGYLANAVPANGGLDARAMLEQPRQAYLLWNFEPEYDTANPALAMRALGNAQTVISFSCFRNGALEYADAILPIAPFLETSGTFVNCEGAVQSFNGAVRPLGESRPGWKVLRVLGTMLGVARFDYDTPEAVRADATPADVGARLSNVLDLPAQLAASVTAAERVADVPVYFSDPIVRRSEPLQQTNDARPPKASANARMLNRFGLVAGAKARVIQKSEAGDASALLEVALDDRLPDGVVRVPAGHAATSTLGAMFGPILLERG